MDNFNEFLVNTGKKVNLVEETISKPMPTERTETFFGNQAINQAAIGILRANLIRTGILESTNGLTFFDLDNGKIQISDSSVPRVILSSVSPYFVISKPGINANTATDAESIIKVDSLGSKVYFSKSWSSPSNTSADTFSGAVAAINYDTGGGGGKNAVLILNFYKDSDWSFTSGELQLKFVPHRYYSGGVVTVYQQDMQVRINPSESVQNNGVNVWLRYSGTALTLDGQGAASFDLSAGALTFTKTLTSGDIATFANGWNSIVIQTDLDDPNSISYGVINLNMVGYETVS